jgi:acetyl-CoA acetyltransferase
VSKSAYVVGVGCTRFAKDGGSYSELCGEAITEAMGDTGLGFDDDRGAIEAIFYANCMQGALTSQHSVRGQVTLRRLGFEGMPVYNVENACASGTTAANLAITQILAGTCDLALAVGVEKMTPPLDEEFLADHPEIAAALPHLGLAVFWFGCEVDRKRDYTERWRRLKSELMGVPFEETSVGGDRSPFMDFYAIQALRDMERHGWTQEQIAKVCSKTHHHSTLNPKAQYQRDFTPEEVLADKLITYPLTRPMCAPTGSGAAAALYCSERYLRQHRGRLHPIRVAASILRSGEHRHEGRPSVPARAARAAFAAAGRTAADIDLAEVHDATSYAEISQTAEIGFCDRPVAGEFCASGATALGGQIPINTSGGLVSKGHPVGCTGLSQIYELVTQLRGRAGARQVPGAQVALHANGGGLIGEQEAALGIEILETTAD